MSEPRIEPLSEREIERFADMVEALYEEDPGDVGMTRERALRQAHEMIARPEVAEPLVIRHGGEVAGYAILAPFWSNEFGGAMLFVDELYVRPEHRGRGLGGAFVEWAKRRARERGLFRIGIEVNDRNPGARRLYERAGFQEERRALLAWQAREP